MSEIKHNKVTRCYYEIKLGGYHRTIGMLISEFLNGMPSVDDEDAWNEQHIAKRDFDGDLDGIIIYPDERIEPIVKFIYSKLGVCYDEFKGVDIHLVS